MVFLSLLIFLFSGYLAFARYWIQTRWSASEATVLSGEIRQSSSGSTSRPGGNATFSNSYFYRCAVSYAVLGQTRQSDLDSPPSPHRIDAQVWAATWSAGQHIAIRYKPSNPAEVRMADNPADLTAMGSLGVAFCFLVPGVLLMLTSRSERLDSR